MNYGPGFGLRKCFMKDECKVCSYKQLTIEVQDEEVHMGKTYRF